MPTKKQVEISPEERLAAAQTDIIFGVRLIEALETLLHQNDVDGDVTFAQLQFNSRREPFGLWIRQKKRQEFLEIICRGRRISPLEVR